MNIVLVAFGAGLAWAAGVIRWGVAGVEPRYRIDRMATTVKERRHDGHE